MDNLRHLLPSAGNLIVFEAAGRHLSFTRAARELGMTQAAVSYAIRSLERQLGTSLFHRAHRAVIADRGGPEVSCGCDAWIEPHPQISRGYKGARPGKQRDAGGFHGLRLAVDAAAAAPAA